MTVQPLLQPMTLRRFIINFVFFTLLTGASASASPQNSTPNIQVPVPAPSSAPQSSSATPVATPSPSPSLAPYTDAPPTFASQGVLVETLDGRVLMEQAANQTFNPASAVKLATALAALRTFGAQHRFTTAVWTDGTFDPVTGTINGNLIIAGRDPSFHYEHAVLLARELNRQGVRTVTGDLIVAPRFTMNFDSSAQRSGEQLYDTLDATRRSAVATRAWNEARALIGDELFSTNAAVTDAPTPSSMSAGTPATTMAARASSAMTANAPSVAVMGAVYVDTVPRNARILLLHRSSKLVDVLKALLCYSNNFMAERIGDTLGGPTAVRRLLIQSVGIAPADVMLASTSGLGINRVTPRAMMRVLRALNDELAKQNLTLSDILPVAGVDPGTLQKRFTTYPSRGSVIAKTGTLTRTDGGASALVGEMRTADNETLLFVIFNQRGSITRFRRNQEALVTGLQNAHGGPAAFPYQPTALALRLSDTETNGVNAARPNEYEPASN